SGKLIGNLQHGPWMNSPWGVVWTPRDFGEYSNSILVGNFGSGKIAAFNGFTGKFIDFVKNPDDSVMVIDGLWMIAFGNDATAGLAITLFFIAGIQGESHGLFGIITPVDGLDGDEEQTPRRLRSSTFDQSSINKKGGVAPGRQSGQRALLSLFGNAGLLYAACFELRGGASKGRAFFHTQLPQHSQAFDHSRSAQ